MKKKNNEETLTEPLRQTSYIAILALADETEE